MVVQDHLLKDILQRGVNDDLKVENPKGLHRGFSSLAGFSLSFASVGITPSISLGLINAVPLGGPAEIIWSWFLINLFTTISGIALGELASAYPQAGSVYLWSGVLGGPRSSRGLACAYVVGWCGAAASISACAAFAAGFAKCVGYCLQIVDAGGTLPTWAEVVISIGACFSWTWSNLQPSEFVGSMNKVGAALLFFGTLVIFLLLTSMTAHRATVEFVFTQGYDCTNFTGIPQDSEGASCTSSVAPYTMCLGTAGALWASVGYDAGAQVAEETNDPSRAGPAGVIGTVLFSFLTGTLFLLAFLFATPDITALRYPVLDTFNLAAGQAAGLGMMVLLSSMVFFAGCASVGASGRMIFALARDGAVPMSHWLQQVSPLNQAPRGALLGQAMLTSILLSFPLFADTVLALVTGSCAALFVFGYSIPCILRITVGRKNFRPGPFSLGVLSIPVHATAAVFNLLALVALMLPTSFPVTAANMNFNSAFIMSVIGGAGIYWVLAGKSTYRGPNLLVSPAEVEELNEENSSVTSTCASSTSGSGFQ